MKTDSPTEFSPEAHDACFHVEDNSFWFKTRNLVIKNFISATKHNQTFADVGGGNGYVAISLQKQTNLKVTLIEPGIGGARNAKIRGVNNVLNSKLEDLDKELMFDHIGLFDVIEHLDDPIKTLREAGRRLNSGGSVYITVPAYRFLWSFDDEGGGHKKRYRLKELSLELEKANLYIDRWSYFNVTLIPFIFVFRTLPFWLGRRKIDTANSHKASLSSRIIERVLTLEYFLFIKNGISIPIGSSLIVRAKKLSL